MEVLKMKYKREMTRLTNFDEKFQALIKQRFSIRLCKTIENFRILINIVETTFLRLTKKSLSWIPKGKEHIIKNICFNNSWSLVIVITSTGSVIAAKRIGTITSVLIIEILKELIWFIKDCEKVEPSDCLIILDNASEHRADIVRKEKRESKCCIYPTIQPRISTYWALLFKVKARSNWGS